jgi:methylmalonyl-CoA mutase
MPNTSMNRDRTMTELNEQLALGGEFPQATRDQWLKLVDGVLKGAPFDKKMISRTYDGLPIEPLYAPAKGAHAVVSAAAGAPW